MIPATQGNDQSPPMAIISGKPAGSTALAGNSGTEFKEVLKKKKAEQKADNDPIAAAAAAAACIPAITLQAPQVQQVQPQQEQATPQLTLTQAASQVEADKSTQALEILVDPAVDSVKANGAKTTETGEIVAGQVQEMKSVNRQSQRSTQAATLPIEQQEGKPAKAGVVQSPREYPGEPVHPAVASAPKVDSAKMAKDTTLPAADAKAKSGMAAPVNPLQQGPVSVEGDSSLEPDVKTADLPKPGTSGRSVNEKTIEKASLERNPDRADFRMGSADTQTETPASAKVSKTVVDELLPKVTVETVPAGMQESQATVSSTNAELEAALQSTSQNSIPADVNRKVARLHVTAYADTSAREITRVKESSDLKTQSTNDAGQVKTAGRNETMTRAENGHFEAGNAQVVTEAGNNEPAGNQAARIDHPAPVVEIRAAMPVENDKTPAKPATTSASVADPEQDPGLAETQSPATSQTKGQSLQQEPGSQVKTSLPKVNPLADSTAEATPAANISAFKPTGGVELGSGATIQENNIAAQSRMAVEAPRPQPEIAMNAGPATQHEPGREVASESVEKSTIPSKQPANIKTAAIEDGVTAMNSQMAGVNTITAEPKAQFTSAHVQQIVEAVDQTLQSGKSFVRIQLHPQDLGTIDIRLSSDARGVAVSITTEHTSTGRLLEGHMENLRQSLSDAGLNLSQMNLNMKGEGSQGERQSFQNYQPAANRGWSQKSWQEKEDRKVIEIPRKLTLAPSSIDFRV